MVRGARPARDIQPRGPRGLPGLRPQPQFHLAPQLQGSNASIARLATLAPSNRIGPDGVAHECARLTRDWASSAGQSTSDIDLEALLGAEGLAEVDRFDRAQLAEVVRVCRTSKSLSAAGRELFQASRAKKASNNDADRLRKYLARFGLTFDGV